ncbi:MAG: peptidyl-tRNA hydrolase [Nanoarchaeota archaeon]
MSNNEKLRIVTVRDIHPGAQLAQSAHAMSQFAVEYPVQFKDWYENSQYVACLSIENEESLLALAEKLRERGIAVSVFREPDYNHKATSIAIEACEQARRLTSNLRLAQKEYYEQWAESQGVQEDPVSNFHITNIKNNIAS